MAGIVTDLGVPQSWHNARRMLLVEVLENITGHNAKRINLSKPSHTATSWVLRQVVYHPEHANRTLTACFMDGSLAFPFPVGCLSDCAKPQATDLPMLRVGLMSFRHPEMDFLVDMYVTRNLELVNQETMAEEENYTFTRTCELFDVPELKDGAVIEVYHTGLEPMVVGFYRGVSEVIRRRIDKSLPRNLIFVPHLLATAPTRENLTPQSPGARPESYVADTPWW